MPRPKRTRRPGSAPHPCNLAELRATHFKRSQRILASGLGCSGQMVHAIEHGQSLSTDVVRVFTILAVMNLTSSPEQLFPELAADRLREQFNARLALAGLATPEPEMESTP